MATSILITNARLIDPASNRDERADLAIKDGRIAAIGPNLSRSEADHTIDAANKILAPGLIDMHVHLREPGQEERETIQSGCAAAVAGGFTAVACMPNTSPALDSDAQIEFVRRQARSAPCKVYPIGAITKGRAGKELAEIGLMLRAGAVAISDDGDGIAEAGVCLRAMQYASMFDTLFIQHCEDKTLAGRGVMNAGVTATRLGLPGIPAAAEEIMAERDIRLARQAACRYHVAHVSTAGTVELVRRAKRDGARVTTEICPHHLLLTEDACSTYDPNFKMNPPLRTRADVDACLAGLRDGTIDCLVTDHAPHSHHDKELGFVDAPMGIIGLETALPLFIKALIEPKILDWPRLIRALSTRPAELLKIDGGTLRVGAPADVTIIDPDVEWTIDRETMKSKSRNTPFHAWGVKGRATHTIVAGEVRWHVVGERTKR